MNFQDISVILGVLAAVGWIFKVWIINPLNASILSIKDTVMEFKMAIERHRQLMSEMGQDIAEAKQSVKSAHRRCDELQERVHALEARCAECAHGERRVSHA